MRTIAPARQGSNAALEKALPRNLAVMLLFELTWGIGMPFAMFVSLAPAYLTALGASKSLIGLLQSLWTVFTPLQLVAGHFFSGRLRMRRVFTFYVLATGARLAYDALAVFLPGLWSPAGLIVFFSLACSAYMALFVLANSLYMGVLTDNVPKGKRGWVYGLRSLFLGVGGIAAGFGASAVLHHVPSTLNYRVCFLIGDTVWTLAALCLLAIRDRPAHAAPRRKPDFLRALLTKLKTLWANPNYRIFLFFYMLNSVALALINFLIPYAKEDLGVPDSSIAALSTFYLLANASLGIFVGRLADRVGYRAVAAAQASLLLCAFIIAVSARSFPAVCVAYALFSLVNNTNGFTLINMSVELCPSLNGTDLMAIGGTLILPFVVISSPLAGRVIDQTGLYLPVFYIGAAVSLISLCGFALIVREPRTGRLYEIRQVTPR
jgi:MFS family permease